MMFPSNKPIQYVWIQMTAQNVHKSLGQCLMQSWDANIPRGVLAQREGGAAQEIHETQRAGTRNQKEVTRPQKGMEIFHQLEGIRIRRWKVHIPRRIALLETQIIASSRIFKIVDEVRTKFLT